MKRNGWMMVAVLGAMLALCAGGALAVPDGTGVGGTCTCSASSLFGSCQLTGPCPCTCFCRPWGHCRCECTGANLANPVGD